MNPFKTDLSLKNLTSAAFGPKNRKVQTVFCLSNTACNPPQKKLKLGRWAFVLDFKNNWVTSSVDEKHA